MSEGFLTDPKTLALFFRCCMRYKLESREDRTALLRELVRRHKAKYIRDVQAFTEGKTVGYIRPKGSN